MKFEGQFFFNVIPEWRGKYVDYKDLVTQIRKIQNVAVSLASAYNNVKDITKTDFDAHVEVSSLDVDKIFWKKLERNIEKVEDFYQSQIEFLIEKFHILVLKSLELRLIDSYEPFQGGLTTRLEREFERLALPADIGLSTLSQKKSTIEPLQKDRYLLSLNKNTTPHEVLAALRKNRKSFDKAKAEYFDFDYFDGLTESDYSREEEEIGKKLDDETQEEGPVQNWGSSDDEDEMKIELSNDDVSVDLDEKSKYIAEQFDDVETKIFRFDRKKTENHLKENFVEFYRGLYLIKQYCKLNVEAIERILMKHDRHIEFSEKSREIKHNLTKLPFYKRRLIKVMMRETESVYAHSFTKGHRTEAMKKLRIPNRDKVVEMSTFKYGIMMGLSLVCMFLIIYACVTAYNTTLANLTGGYISFRMCTTITAFLWFWGIDIWIWSNHRVNYPFLLEFGSGKSIRHQTIFNYASAATLAIGILCLIYTLAGIQHFQGTVIKGLGGLANIPLQIFPIILICIVFIAFMISQFRSNWWIIICLRRILITPALSIRFQDFFVAEQLLSFIIIINDFIFTICHIAVDSFPETNKCSSSFLWVYPIVSSIIVLERSLQCVRRYKDLEDVRQITNAFRYALILVVIWSSYLGYVFPNTTISFHKTIWPISSLIVIFFHTYWDIRKEWDLGYKRVQFKFLRTQLLFRPSWYYFGIIMNFFLRFVWILTFSPDIVRLTYNPEILSTVLALLELARRAIWNGIMIEKEQLNNGSKFRSMRNITQPLTLRYT